MTKKEGAEKEKKQKTLSPKEFFVRILKAIVKTISWSFIFVCIFIAIIVFGSYIKFSNDFKYASPKSIGTQNVFYDRNGNLLYKSFGAAKPKEVELSDISDNLIKAVVASEDQNFYNHKGADPEGILRAIVKNVKNSPRKGLSKINDLFDERGYIEGGSTITQQLVKNLYLEPEKTFKRKIKEIIFAIELEKKYSKEEILKEYLNSIYFGEQSYGVYNASKRYFAKEPNELTLGEASLLAGLIQSPSILSPISGNYEKAKERQKYVLSQMYYQGYISFQEAQDAYNEKIYFNYYSSEDTQKKCPFFIDFIENSLKDKVGSKKYEEGGLEIYTTVDLEPCNQIQEIINKNIKNLRYRNATNGAAVIIDNNSHQILAMVGGTNYTEDKVNLATSKRQPGSSFKPFVYTAGFLKGYTPASLLWDSYVKFDGNPPYVPRNYDGRYRGYVTVRRALANSLNVPAVEMTQLVGIDEVIKTAKKFGLEIDDREYGLSLGLGSAEISLLDNTNAYTVFANNGKYAKPVSILRVTDNNGHEIYKEQAIEEEVIDPRIAFQITNILSDNKTRAETFGYYSDLYIKNLTTAAKTGTTDNYTNAWTIGYTTYYTVGVLVGNNDGSPMKYLPGIEGATPIWKKIMENIHSSKKNKEFKKPQNISEVRINPYTGKKVNYQGGSSIIEYFLPGTEPANNPDLSYLDPFRYYWKY